MNFYRLNGTLLRIASRYDNLYPYDVTAESSSIYINGSLSVRYRLTGGYATELFMHLQTLLNFRYEVVSEVGAYDFSSAENKSIDIFMASYSLTYARALIVTPTFSTGRSKVMAFFNHENESLDLSLFFPPFSRRMWYGVLVFLLLSFTCVLIIGSQQVTRNIFDLPVHFVSTVVHNEYRKHLGPSQRIAFFSISVATFILMSSYTGNMTSMKSVHSCALDSTHKLIYSTSNHRFMVETGMNSVNSTIRLFLEKLAHTSSSGRKLWRRVEHSSAKNVTFEQAIREVQRKPTIYIIDEQTGHSTAEKVLGRFPCTWKGVHLFDKEYPWTMYMRHRSSYKSSINYGLLKLQESGITHRIASKWLPRENTCPVFVLPFRSITISQIRYAVSVLAVGLFCGTVSVLLEKGCSNFTVCTKRCYKR